MELNVTDIKLKLFVNEAKRWVSFTESGGDNRGQIVEAFQRVVDGKATGEAWCLCFVQYCLLHVDVAVSEIFDRTFPLHSVEKTEHCLTCWHKSPVVNKYRFPKEGLICIWRHGASTRGHAGVVVKVEKGTGYIWTVEGNTGPQNSTVQREGDGIYLKRRSLNGSGSMKIMGFIQPWV